MSQANVLVRFTGSSPGTRFYEVSHRTRRYKFGQNSDHFQAQIPTDEWAYLKAAYPRLLLEVPFGLYGKKMDLSCPIKTSTLLLDWEKEKLIRAGFSTVGSVMGDPDAANAVLGPDSNAVERLENVIFYDEDPVFRKDPPMAAAEVLQKADDLTQIEFVGPYVQNKLNELGYYMYWDVAERLTLKEYLSITGSISARFERLKSSAKALAGGK